MSKDAEIAGKAAKVNRLDALLQVAEEPALRKLAAIRHPGSKFCGAEVFITALKRLCLSLNLSFKSPERLSHHCRRKCVNFSQIRPV